MVIINYFCKKLPHVWQVPKYTSSVLEKGQNYWKRCTENWSSIWSLRYIRHICTDLTLLIYRMFTWDPKWNFVPPWKIIYHFFIFWLAIFVFIKNCMRRCFISNDFISGDTVWNTVISSNFLVWKFCGKTQFPHSFGREILWKGTVSAVVSANRPKLCRNCAFPQNFHTKKLGEIALFYVVVVFTLQLSPGMKFHFCQNDRNKITPVTGFIPGYFM